VGPRASLENLTPTEEPFSGSFWNKGKQAKRSNVGTASSLLERLQY